jgi:hypothetical protein
MLTIQETSSVKPKEKTPYKPFDDAIRLNSLSSNFHEWCSL